MLLRFALSDGMVELRAAERPPTIPGKGPLADAVPVYVARADDVADEVASVLLATLHQTLDLRKVLRRFQRLTAPTVGHSGLHFEPARPGEEITVGRHASKRVRIDIQLESHNLGRLTVLSTDELGQASLDRLRGYLGYLAYPLRNALRYDDAIRTSVTDELTAIHNRSYLDAALRREVSLARRHASALSLIMLDIDGFKQINDRHGHRAGDEVLQEVAARLRRTLRETDILARYGGDEFVVVLSNTGRRGAFTVANLIMNEIRREPFATSELRLPVAVTLGIASLLKRDEGDSLFRRADEALYKAKEAGRERTGVATTRGVRIFTPQQVD